MTVKSFDGFVIFTLSEHEAKLGNNKRIDGNGFDVGTDIQGDVVIPDYISSYRIIGIGEFAIRNCHKITSLKLPSTLISIDYGSITLVSKIESITFPRRMEVIGNNIDKFDMCKSVSFEAGAKLKIIGSYFMRYCP